MTASETNSFAAFRDLIRPILLEAIRSELPLVSLSSTDIDDGLRVRLSHEGTADFDFVWDLPFVKLVFLDTFTYYGDSEDCPLEYPTKFTEIIRDVLKIVKKYYAGELVVSQSRTKILRRETRVFTDVHSNDRYTFIRFRR